MGFLFKLSVVIFILALITFGLSYYFRNYSNLNETYILDSNNKDKNLPIASENNKIEDNQLINNNLDLNNLGKSDVRVLIPVEEKNKNIKKNQSENLDNQTTTIENEENELFEINIEAKEFKFEPNIFKVKEGQQVKLIIKNTGKIIHNLKIEKDNIVFQTSLIAPGDQALLEFKAPSAGEYDFYCTIDDHKLRGMFGKMIVE
ncbi:MAG: hypothetical protein KatS3mg095_0735 [Candidatus Parcubacteria bacterium]|nr:MAG: hypothetical protein KatS3mg095_0735 [Candidatus Parcubacteria bacterium]